MAIDPDNSTGGIPVETEALKALQFYSENYDQLVFSGLGVGNEQVILGTKPLKCRFCDGEPPSRTFKKRAHAISELLGNKALKSIYECDQCNERFSAFEDDLAKMTLPYRSIGGIIGKNGVPKLISATGESKGKSRMEFQDGTLRMSHMVGDDSFVVDESTKTISFLYAIQSYRPLGAYKALCKCGFTLLPRNELENFYELKEWLQQSDLVTGQVYETGSHGCYRSFVAAYRPFPQPTVVLHRRRKLIDAPYMSMFIAFGNVSY